jgi:ATP-dependent DNA helicase RecG
LPDPVLKEEQGGFFSKLFKDQFTVEQYLRLGLNDRQVKAVGHVKRKGKITNKEYQQLNDVSKKTATRDLTELVRKGIFIGSGVKGAGAFYKLKLEGP